MDREEILKRSRNENQHMDERERNALALSGQRACAVGGLVCMVILLLSAVTDRLTSEAVFAVWTVYLSITGSRLIAKYAVLKRRHELIFGVMQLVLALVFFALYLRSVFG